MILKVCQIFSGLCVRVLEIAPKEKDFSRKPLSGLLTCSRGLVIRHMRPVGSFAFTKLTGILWNWQEPALALLLPLCRLCKALWRRPIVVRLEWTAKHSQCWVHRHDEVTSMWHMFDIYVWHVWAWQVNSQRGCWTGKCSFGRMHRRCEKHNSIQFLSAKFLEVFEMFL